MRISQVMKKDVEVVALDDNLAAAASRMWDCDIGSLPVVDGAGQVAGMVTDRDICMAALTRGQPLHEIPVSVAMAKEVLSCTPDDEIHEAVLTMAENHVRRLPVVDGRGVVQGVLSMDDIITHGDLNKWQGCCELSAEEIIRSLKRLFDKHSKAQVKARAA